MLAISSRPSNTKNIQIKQKYTNLPSIFHQTSRLASSYEIVMHQSTQYRSCLLKHVLTTLTLNGSIRATSNHVNPGGGELSAGEPPGSHDLNYVIVMPSFDGNLNPLQPSGFCEKTNSTSAFG